MTKTEITEKSNAYKIEYNKCKHCVENFNNTIKSFGKLKHYFEKSLTKIHKRKFASLFCLIVSLPASLICLTFSLPLSFILLGISCIMVDRFIFFHNTIKKFEHCHAFLSNSIKTLLTRQNSYELKCESALKEIISLESTIPEEVVNQISNQANLITKNKKDESITFSL